MVQRYRDIIAGTVLMVLSVVLFISAFYIKSAVSMNVGPDMMPKLASAVLFILGLAITAQGAVDLKKGKTDEDQEDAGKLRAGRLGAGKTMGLMVIYAAVIPTVGFLVSTSVYAFLQMMILSPADKKKPALFALVSVLSTVIIYFAFTKAFHLMLPAGIIG